MSKTIKCQKCGKESPESGVLFDRKSVKEALSAPLDCNGNPIYDFSELKESRLKNENYCYWCGAKIEPEQEQRLAPKPTSQPQTMSVPNTAKPSQPPKRSGCIVLTILLLIVGGVIWFCFRSCTNSDDYSDDNTDSYEYVESEDEPGETVEAQDDSSDSSSANVKSPLTEFKVNDYSKEWAKLEADLKKLGTPINYVNSQSSKGASAIKDAAYDEYYKIKDEAFDLYYKIKDEAYDVYYEIKDKAYAKYDEKELKYSEYSKIQSEAYSKYNRIQSEAYSKYNKLQSEAYSWYSKVSSITFNM